MDRFSVQEQMRIDGERNKLIDQRKEQEKQKAEAEIYASLPTTINTDLIFNDNDAKPEVR